MSQLYNIIIEIWMQIIRHIFISKAAVIQIVNYLLDTGLPLNILTHPSIVLIFHLYVK